MVGIDFYRREHLAAAAEAGAYYRGLLAQLTPATAHKVGYENAAQAYRL